MNDIDKTVREDSVPPMSSGSQESGHELLQTGMMQPPPNPGLLGTVGRYQVVRLLGEGGMGQVLLAREPVTDSLVAIKMIKAEFVRKDWAVHRFLTEARHMYRMSHPSIIRVLDVSDRPEGPYFVMPFMAGGSLAQKIKPGEPLAADLLPAVARQVADALHYAHTQGIIHRDLKPSNILLDAEGRAYLSDFGLLRTVFNDSIVDVGQQRPEGTVPYMSPAVACGKAEDTRCDIYAFGCLLYELLTGQPPYQGPTIDAILKQIQTAPPRPIRELNPKAPANLVAIADHAMGRELRDRYASMGDVVAELDRVAQGESPFGPHGRANGAFPVKKVMAAIGIAALIGLVAFGLSMLLGRKPFVATSDEGNVSPVEMTQGPFKYAINTRLNSVTISRYTGPGGEVTIPKMIDGIPVTAVGNYAFMSCTGLTSVAIPNSVTSIGPQAFRGCVRLTRVTIPASVTSLRGTPFKDCSGLLSFVVDDANPVYSSSQDGVVFSKDRTFLVSYPGGKTGAYEIPDGVTGIGDGAFTDCRSLTRVTVPSSVRRIENLAFGYCRDQFKGLFFEGNVPALPSGNLFTGSDNLIIYYRPDTKGWGPTFGGRPTAVWEPEDAPALPKPTGATPAPLVEGPFTYTVTNGAVTIVKYAGPGGDVAIPEKIKGMPVTEIHSAFRDCTNLTSITIPTTVKNIASFSFSSCTALTNPFIPASVTNMGSSPFIRCNRVTSITVDAKNPNYSSEDGIVFDKEKTALFVFPAGRTGNYTVPDRVTRIKGNAFRDCHGLTGVTLPPSIEVVEFSAFSRCPGLSGVYFSGDAPDLGAGAFDFCNATIYYRPGTKGWGKEFGGRPTALWEPEKDAKPSLPQTSGVTPAPLTEGPFSYTVTNGAVTIVKYTGPGGNVTIPDKIKGLPVAAIGENAFRECATLTGVTIPDTVAAFGSRAFQDCKELTTVTIPGSVVDTGDRTFMGCIGLTNVTMKSGVTTIGFASFAGCSGLTHIALPNTVTRFAQGAFRGSGLHSITIPSSVATMDGFALSDCTNLTEITIPANVTSIRGAFMGRSALISIKVDPANPVYSSSPDGVLLNKDGTCLVIFPGGKPGNYDIPAGIRTVGVHAFNGCTYLTSVTLPESLTSIEQEAFRGCENLTALTFKGHAPRLGKDVFEGIGKGAIFYHLPTAKGWGKEFGGRPTAVWEPQVQSEAPVPPAPGAAK
jgi:hypothetical protein